MPGGSWIPGWACDVRDYRHGSGRRLGFDRESSDAVEPANPASSPGSSGPIPIPSSPRDPTRLYPWRNAIDDPDFYPEEPVIQARFKKGADQQVGQPEANRCAIAPILAEAEPRLGQAWTHTG